MFSPDVVQLILEHMPFYSFRRCRLLCKQWHAVSLRCNKQWYKWLTRFGRVSHYEYHDHKARYPRCIGRTEPTGPGCRLVHHFERIVKVPHVLKTVPLHIQVFQTGVKKKLKKSSRVSAFWADALQDRAKAYNSALRMSLASDALLRKREGEAAYVAQMRSDAGRKRIRISNLQE